jgi:hypothetical protein
MLAASSATRTRIGLDEAILTPPEGCPDGGEDRKPPDVPGLTSEEELEVIVPVFGAPGGRLYRPERAISAIGRMTYIGLSPDA